MLAGPNASARNMLGIGLKATGGARDDQPGTAVHGRRTRDFQRSCGRRTRPEMWMNEELQSTNEELATDEAFTTGSTAVNSATRSKNNPCSPSRNESHDHSTYAYRSHQRCSRAAGHVAEACRQSHLAVGAPDRTDRHQGAGGFARGAPGRQRATATQADESVEFKDRLEQERDRQREFLDLCPSPVSGRRARGRSRRRTPPRPTC